MNGMRINVLKMLVIGQLFLWICALPVSDVADARMTGRPLQHAGDPDDPALDADPGDGYDLDDPDLCACLEDPSDCEEYDSLDGMVDLSCDRCCDGAVCGLDQKIIDVACTECPDYDSAADCPSGGGYMLHEYCPDPGDLNFVGCDCWLKDSAQDAADWLTNHWTDYVNFVQAEGQLAVQTCLQGRMENDSTIRCQEVGTTECGPTTVGFAYPFTETMYICPGFTDDVEPLSSDERQACSMAIMAHEFSHTCLRPEWEAELLGRLTFEFYVTHPGIGLNMAFWECGM